MAVTVIDPAAGVIQRGIASVGDALGQRLRERGNNAARIINDPVRRESIAEAYRAALLVSPEAGETLLESLRVPDDFGETLLSFQATPEELGRAADVAGGVPQVQSEARGTTAELVVARGDAELRSDVIETELLARVRTGELTTASIDALLASDVIEADVAERLATALLGAATGEARLAAGVPEVEAAADVGTAQVQIARTSQILSQNLAEAEVTAARVAAEVQTETGQQLLNSNLIRLTSENDVRQSIINRISLTAQQLLDIPRLRVEVERDVLTTQQLEAEYAAGLIRHRIENGIPKLTVSREVLALNAEIAGLTDSIKFAKAAGDYLDSLDQTTADGKRLHDEFILGMENPAFLAHIGIHEQLSERAALSRAAVTASNSAEIFDNTLTMMQEIEEAVEFLAAAETDEIPFAQQQLTNLRHLASKMMVTGRLEPINLIGADMHGKRFEYFYEDVDSDAVHFAIGVAGEGLLEGETSEQVLEAINAADDELGGRSLFDSMSPADQEMFMMKFPLLVEDVNAAQALIADRTRAGIAALPSERGARAQQRSADNRLVMIARAEEILEDRNAPLALRNAIDAGDRREIGIQERRIAQAQSLIAQGPLFVRQMILPGTSQQDLLLLIQETFPEVGNLPR